MAGNIPRGKTLLVVLFLALLPALGGCSSAPPRQTELMQNIEGVEISTREMQVRLYAYSSVFSAKVERAADEIYVGTDDPSIRVNALAWKIHAIPAMHNQIFVEDPLVGAVNAYALCRQMTIFLSPSGAGAEVFGDQQVIARAAADSVERAVVDLMVFAKSGGDISEIRTLINDFAEAFPLDSLNFARRSSNGFMAPALAGESVGGLAAAAAMNEQLRVFNDRVAIYAEAVPKQLRWQPSWPWSSSHPSPTNSARR